MERHEAQARSLINVAQAAQSRADAGRYVTPHEQAAMDRVARAERLAQSHADTGYTGTEEALAHDIYVHGIGEW